MLNSINHAAKPLSFSSFTVEKPEIGQEDPLELGLYLQNLTFKISDKGDFFVKDNSETEGNNYKISLNFNKNGKPKDIPLEEKLENSRAESKLAEMFEEETFTVDKTGITDEQNLLLKELRLNTGYQKIDNIFNPPEEE
ncbi:MAG: hypothetical protein KAQ92_01455 [Candidatus Aenigmarchaeota archaeon]|nr:hypothetical protein [Candidatus Aenigmarchaeota archaeon]